MTAPKPSQRLPGEVLIEGLAGSTRTLCNTRGYIVDEATGCWLWQGHLDDHGYGNLSRKKTTVKAHRAVYELLVGPIPEGLQLDHLCRNPQCVNPSHLEPVTGAENVRRGSSVKYPVEFISRIKQELLDGVPLIELARKHEMSSTYISYLNLGKVRADVLPLLPEGGVLQTCVCLTCGKEFLAARYDQKFCCDRCYMDAKNERARIKDPKIGYCIDCEDPFEKVTNKVRCDSCQKDEKKRQWTIQNNKRDRKKGSNDE